MITYRNLIANLNFNYILIGLFFISFFYFKNLFNKLYKIQQLYIFILNNIFDKIKLITNKNKKNYNKFNKKIKKNKKKIKKFKKILNENNNFYLKYILNIESKKIIDVKSTTPPINNVEINQPNSITVDEENEFEILD